MGQIGWHVSELIINMKSYHVGKLYNTPKGLMRLDWIDAVKEEFRFMDRDDNFVTIRFVEFL